MTHNGSQLAVVPAFVASQLKYIKSLIELSVLHFFRSLYSRKLLLEACSDLYQRTSYPNRNKKAVELSLLLS